MAEKLNSFIREDGSYPVTLATGTGNARLPTHPVAPTTGCAGMGRPSSHFSVLSLQPQRKGESDFAFCSSLPEYFFYYLNHSIIRLSFQMGERVRNSDPYFLYS